MSKLNIDTPSSNKDRSRSLTAKELKALEHARKKYNDANPVRDDDTGEIIPDKPIATPEQFLQEQVLENRLKKLEDEMDAEALQIEEAYRNADESTKSEVKNLLGI